MKRKKKRNQPKKKVDIGYYVVGYLDVLGQQERLRSLRDLPDQSNETQMESFIKDLKGTFGVVKDTRRMFEGYFESFSKKKSDISMLTSEQRKIYKRLTSKPIQIKSFSDAIIVFVSLATGKEKLPAKGVWSIIAATASTALLSLAAGHPIRGGIDIGLGMEIERDEIYGPSLSRAYSLESKIAGYPRIVVGKECINYLEVTAGQQPKDIYEQVSVATARDCLNLLTIDDDGWAIVDYLGNNFRESIGKGIQKEIILKAYNNIVRFSEEFQTTNNSKIAFRYTLLRSYFDHRLSQWEICN